jgi:hypothetical protein
VRGRSPKRKSVLALLGVAGAAAVGLPIAALAGPGPTVLPDMISQPPERPITSVYGDGRLLLRFDGFVSNSATAAAPVEVRARTPSVSWSPQDPLPPPEHPMASVEQWGGNITSPGQGGQKIQQADGGPPRVQFETADDHMHYHLKDAAEYTLWNEAGTAQVAVAQKTDAGFCLEDTQRIGGSGTPQRYSVSANGFCWQWDNPSAPSNLAGRDLVMGIGVGWRDVYHRDLTYQWVDISNVQPGRYRLASRVDPGNVIRESDEHNPYAFMAGTWTVDGYVAKPVTVAQAGAPTTVALGADGFGAPPGPLRFRIESAPVHGSINHAVGTVLGPGATVTYTPKPGYLGSDAFTYVALSEGWPYPRTPQAAAVSLAGNSVGVAISGAPASLLAGTSAQLAATVVNAPGGVSWSVNGIGGGNAGVGTITPGGLYVAPAGPPPGGAVTIQARSVENPEAVGHAVVGITAPPSKPKPAQSVAGKLSAGSKLLSKVKTSRVNRRVLVAKVATGRRAGKVTVTATFKRKVLGRCVARVPARREFTCKVRLKRNYPLTKVRFTAKLTVSGKTQAVRRAWAVTPRRR